MKQIFRVKFLSHDPTVHDDWNDEHRRRNNAGNRHVFEVKLPQPIAFCICSGQKSDRIWSWIWKRNGMIFTKSIRIFVSLTLLSLSLSFLSLKMGKFNVHLTRIINFGQFFKDGFYLKSQQKCRNQNVTDGSNSKQLKDGIHGIF